jgi:hypothetical protein
MRLVTGVLTLAIVLSGVLLGGNKAAAVYTGLYLPWPRNVSHSVTQTPGPYEDCSGTEPPSHCSGFDLWAYDFGMQVGETVSAAHHGTVLGYQFGFGQTPFATCEDPSFIPKANYIVLNHNDGFSSQYWHLNVGSALVSPGQVVYQGRPLAGADTSGSSCGPHLHFAVITTPPCNDGYYTCRGQSQQISFAEAGEPAWGCCYTSSNRLEFSAAYLSQSPFLQLTPGQLGTFTIQYRNAGYNIWNRDVNGLKARLGTNAPIPGINQPSLIGGMPGCAIATDWVACDRVTTTTVQVDPDQSGWFQFQVRGPSTPGIYKLYLRPVIEGVLWMEDVGLFVQVTVP